MFLHLRFATKKVTDRMIDHTPHFAGYLMQWIGFDVAFAPGIPLQRSQGFGIDLGNMSLSRSATPT